MEPSQTFFLLSPVAMGFVPTFLMQLVILIALFTWKHKSKATWLLIGWQVSLFLMIGSILAGHSIYDPFGGYLYWIGGITLAWLANVLAIQLAYHFPRVLYPREARVVLVLSLTVWVGLVALMSVEAINAMQEQEFVYGFESFHYSFLVTDKEGFMSSVKVFNILHPLTFAWPPIIWLRQAMYLSHQNSGRPHPPRPVWLRAAWWRSVAVALWSRQHNDARIARIMVLVFSAALLSPLASMLEERNIVPGGTFAASFLIAEALFVLTYLDYSPESTTFKVKLVGIVLVTMMLLIGLVAPMVLKWTQQFYHDARQNEVSTIKHLLAHDITDQMPPRVLYVATRPAAGGLFASSYQVVFNRTLWVDAPMLHEQDARLRALTEHRPALFWQNFIHVYPWINQQCTSIPTRQQLEQLTIPDQVVSYRGHFEPPEHHIVRYTFHLDADTLGEVGYSYPAYRQVLHMHALPLLWLTVGAIVIFLLLVPLFIQVSMVQPLTALQEGVRRVESGDLDTHVPVRVTDEIGFLTGAFNRMVASLNESRTALTKEIAIRLQKEHELVALTDTLEQRVAERTRALTALYDVSAIAGQMPALEAMSRLSLPRILTAVQSSMGMIYLLDEPVELSTLPVVAPALRLVASQGVPPHLLESLNVLPGDRGLGGQVVAHGKPLLVNNLASNTRIPSPLRQSGYPLMYVAPLRAGSKMYGLLLLLRTTNYTLEEQELAISLADHIGKAAEKHVLFQQSQQLALLEERQRLARELHDSITQLLYGLVMLTEAGQTQLEGKGAQPDVARHTFVRIGETARQVIKEIRLFIHQLRPSALEQEGLVGAIQLRLAAVEGRADIQTRLQADETIRLPRMVEESLYQVTQEALNNTLRHAQATSVTVTLQQHDDYVLLEICDNGSGFDPHAHRTGGMGLENMQVRVQNLGGTIDLLSTPGQGTTVRVVVPGGSV
jgi:signal transduction histidine kinase